MRMFQSFRLDTANQCLWHGEARADLTPKAFDVLRYLVEHAGRLVTPDEASGGALAGDLCQSGRSTEGTSRKSGKCWETGPTSRIFIETRAQAGIPVYCSRHRGELRATTLDLPTETAKKIVGRERGPSRVGPLSQ